MKFEWWVRDLGLPETSINSANPEYHFRFTKNDGNFIGVNIFRESKARHIFEAWQIAKKVFERDTDWREWI